MDFVGNNAWFAVLLVIHVVGAIAGIGPAFSFGILSVMAGKAKPETALALMEAIHKIESVMLRPVELATQWITGVLLIFNRGLDHDFFSPKRAWLTISIVLYVVLLLIGEFVAAPTVKKMMAAARAGRPGSEVAEAGSAMKTIGPLAPLLTLIIIVLMVWKPGSGCPALRC